MILIWAALVLGIVFLIVGWRHRRERDWWPKVALALGTLIVILCLVGFSAY